MYGGQFVEFVCVYWGLRVKPVCETPQTDPQLVYPDLSTHHDWPVK